MSKTATREADYLLYRLSQHKHGWLYLSPSDASAADDLEERQEAYRSRSNRLKLEVSKLGRLRIEDRWPHSPLTLETYEPPLGSWTPFEPIAGGKDQ